MTTDAAPGISAAVHKDIARAAKLPANRRFNHKRLNRADPASSVARDREQKAFERRKGGASYNMIGRELGVTTPGRRTPRRSARLNCCASTAMLSGIWKKATRGDAQAVNAALKWRSL